MKMYYMKFSVIRSIEQPLSKQLNDATAFCWAKGDNPIGAQSWARYKIEQNG